MERIVGNPVKEFRKKIGMNRITFARKTGISYETVVRLELAYSETLTDKTAGKLAAVFGKPADMIKEDYARFRAGLMNLEQVRAAA